jgi:hypothetical protein
LDYVTNLYEPPTSVEMIFYLCRDVESIFYKPVCSHWKMHQVNGPIFDETVLVQNITKYYKTPPYDTLRPEWVSRTFNN